MLENGCVLDQSFSHIEFLSSWVTLPAFNIEQTFFLDGRCKLHTCHTTPPPTLPTHKQFNSYHWSSSLNGGKMAEVTRIWDCEFFSRCSSCHSFQGRYAEKMLLIKFTLSLDIGRLASKFLYWTFDFSTWGWNKYKKQGLYSPLTWPLCVSFTSSF